MTSKTSRMLLTTPSQTPLVSSLSLSLSNRSHLNSRSISKTHRTNRGNTHNRTNTSSTCPSNSQTWEHSHLINRLYLTQVAKPKTKFWWDSLNSLMSRTMLHHLPSRQSKVIPTKPRIQRMAQEMFQLASLKTISSNHYPSLWSLTRTRKSLIT